MGLLDGFEKLINEHGSATILKERIALANDKYSALEKEFAASKLREAESKARETELEAENQSLKLDNEKLRQEIQRRDDVIQNEKSHNNLLDEEKVKILMALTRQEWVYAEQISRFLGIGLQIIQFHLDELQENNMVCASYSMVDAAEWSLDHEGRRYLIKNKLIS